MNAGPMDLAKLQGQLEASRAQLRDLLKTHATFHPMAVEIRGAISALEDRIRKLSESRSDKQAATQPVSSEEAHLRLTQAEMRLKRVKAMFEAGLIHWGECEDAKFDRDIAAALVRGDLAEVRSLEVRKAEARLELAKKMSKQGLMTMSEVEDAEFAVQLARAHAPATTRAAAASQPTAALQKRAAAFVDLLAKHEFAQAVREFDDTMRTALPAGKLAEVWGELEKAGGKFLGADPPARVEEIAQCMAVYVPCRWEHNRLDVKVVFDQGGKINGLWTVAPGAK
jgi:hypothetical protein